MPKAWKEWEGRVVNKEFRLGEYLGGSEGVGVFMTQYGSDSLKAAVKLIPIAAWDQPTTEAELSRLQSARGLSHPHLLQIFAAGRTTLDDTEIIFMVMEYADEDLSQILPKRPLTPAEVREMLSPALEALSYLHGKGFVHGHLKPSNVMAIGDQLKLSSDGISPSAGGRSAAQDRSDYAAPELAQGEISMASDVWSLGMLLVTALTQHLPAWDATRTELILPANVLAPFDDIARRCLRRDPGARISLEEIAARLGLRVSVTAAPAPAKPELQQSPAVPRAAIGPQLSSPRPKPVPVPEGFPYRRRSNNGAYVAVAVVLVIVGILVIPRMFRSGKINSQLTTLQADSTAQQEQTTPAQAPNAASKIAQVSDQGTSSEIGTGTNLVRGEQPARTSATRAKTPRRGLTAGEVADQVVPDVPQSARDTIHGTVRVSVRLSVDTAGNVTEAELDLPGPSKYFARLALEAAQQWKFDPPKMQGQNVLSDWLLHFQFTGQGTKVVPVQSDP
jgi:TonB family protein